MFFLFFCFVFFILILAKSLFSFSQSYRTTEEKPVSKKKCSRNFITLSDEKLYPVIFPKKSGRPPTKLYCPVTRMPAKYIDPVTSIPYATKKAFKIIRETYSTEIENAMMDRRKKQKKAAKT